jgi:hypothetical protein
MTDAERKASEADRIMAEIAPYCEQVERDAYEALLLETDEAKILEGRRLILASRKFQAALRTAITLGAQAARKAPAVA